MGRETGRRSRGACSLPRPRDAGPSTRAASLGRVRPRGKKVRKASLVRIPFWDVSRDDVSRWGPTRWVLRVFALVSLRSRNARLESESASRKDERERERPRPPPLVSLSLSLSLERERVRGPRDSAGDVSHAAAVVEESAQIVSRPFPPACRAARHAQARPTPGAPHTHTPIFGAERLLFFADFVYEKILQSAPEKSLCLLLRERERERERRETFLQVGAGAPGAGDFVRVLRDRGRASRGRRGRRSCRRAYAARGGVDAESERALGRDAACGHLAPRSVQPQYRLSKSTFGVWERVETSVEAL